VCLSRRWGLGAARRRTTWSARGAHQQAARGAALPASGESHAEDGARGAEKGRGLLRPNLERGVCQSGGGPHRVSPSLIAEQWDEMLRLATRPNRVTASLLVQPPSGQLRGPRSPTPCWTTGRGWSRPSSSCYLTAPYDRRSIHRPLNKGESISVLETPSSAATKARRCARVATRADASSARSSTAGGAGDHRVAGAVGRSLFTTDFRCEVTITATRTSPRRLRACSGLGLWRGSAGDGVLV